MAAEKPAATPKIIILRKRGMPARNFSMPSLQAAIRCCFSCAKAVEPVRAAVTADNSIIRVVKDMAWLPVLISGLATASSLAQDAAWAKGHYESEPQFTVDGLTHSARPPAGDRRCPAQSGSSTE